MIAQFHTPKGVFTVDTDTITDKELANKFNMTGQDLNDFLAEQPRDLEAEVDDLKSRVAAVEQKAKAA